jgi:hypothetical protein
MVNSIEEFKQKIQQIKKQILWLLRVNLLLLKQFQIILLLFIEHKVAKEMNFKFNFNPIIKIKKVFLIKKNKYKFHKKLSLLLIIKNLVMKNQTKVNQAHN